MSEPTLFDQGPTLGFLGKLLFLYMAGVLIVLATRSFKAALQGGRKQLRLLAPLFERCAISLTLLTLCYACLIGWMVCQHGYYGSDFENSLTRTLHEAIIHFRVLAGAFSVSTIIYFIGWSLTPPSGSKTDDGGV